MTKSSLMIVLVMMMMMAITVVTSEKVVIKINTAADAPGAASTNTWSYSGGTTTTTTTTTPTATTTTTNTPAAVPTSSSSSSSFPPQTPTLFREAAALTLPALHEATPAAEHAQWLAAWRTLDGKCFQTRTSEYVYELCPFRNVTQRGVSSTLHVVLGLWGAWTAHEGAPFSQLYTDGNVCSSGRRRETEVRLVCAATPADGAPVPVVANPAEPRGCAYSLDFTLSLACTDLTAPAVAAVATSSLSQCRAQVTERDALVTEMRACIAWLLADPTQQEVDTATPCTPHILRDAGLTDEQQSAAAHASTHHISHAADRDVPGAAAVATDDDEETEDDTMEAPGHSTL